MTILCIIVIFWFAVIAYGFLKKNYSLIEKVKLSMCYDIGKLYVHFSEHAQP